METKSPTPMANSLQSNNTTSAQNPQLPAVPGEITETLLFVHFCSALMHKSLEEDI